MGNIFCVVQSINSIKKTHGNLDLNLTPIYLKLILHIYNVKSKETFQEKTEALFKA